MKEIKLTQGKVALVDDEDFEYLSQWRWCAQNRRGYFYAARGVYDRAVHYTRSVSMHRQLMGVTDPNILVDHKDFDTLNNQRSNLRVCTKLQNNCNKRALKNSSSKYLGVSKRDGKWIAQVRHNFKSYFLGYFTSEDDAAMAYNKGATEHHGEFANLNRI